MASSPTNALPSDSQPLRRAKPRKSSKPTTVQTAVIAKYSSGESKLQIAKDLGMARGTVDSILNASEIEQHLLEARSRTIRLIPKSIDVAEYRLSKNDGSMAIAILRGTNVLQNQQVTATTNNYQANTWITMQAQKAAERTSDSITLNASNEPSDNPPSKSEL